MLELGGTTRAVAGSIAIACIGCAGIPVPPPASVTPLAHHGTVHHDYAPSWMKPDASGQSLLYVSDQGNDDVMVYTFPFGMQVGKLTGFRAPSGLCTDSHANVWIINSTLSEILEYAHGGTTPIQTLSDSTAVRLFDCSVDPLSQNLAVTDLGSVSASGGVLVFDKARGVPKRYQNPDLQYVYFCGYDNLGNLFIDGLDATGRFHLFELVRGGKSLTSITLKGSVVFPGAIQWDGKYLAIGDQAYGHAHHSAIYQVVVSGSIANIHSLTKLGSSCDVLEFWIGTQVVAPDVCLNNVHFYRYPAGGAPINTLSRLQSPFGATVSP